MTNYKCRKRQYVPRIHAIFRGFLSYEDNVQKKIEVMYALNM